MQIINTPTYTTYIHSFSQIEEVKKMKIGDPLDLSTAHGPQNHKAHFDSLLNFIEAGKKEGAKLVYGGNRVGDKGIDLSLTFSSTILDM